MVGSYDSWREGIGYDLDALKTASPEELVAIAPTLVTLAERNATLIAAIEGADTSGLDDRLSSWRRRTFSRPSFAGIE